MMAYRTDIDDFTLYDDIFMGIKFERIEEKYPDGAGSSAEPATVMAPTGGIFVLVDSESNEIYYFNAATRAA
jgi:hypothetical protein